MSVSVCVCVRESERERERERGRERTSEKEKVNEFAEKGDALRGRVPEAGHRILSLSLSLQDHTTLSKCSLPDQIKSLLIESTEL